MQGVPSSNLGVPTKFEQLIVIRDALFRLWLMDSRRKLRHVVPHLHAMNSVLDIGCGAGSVAISLRGIGFQVTPVDINNASLTPRVTPLIFDGRRLPFRSGTFDAALLLTVLHHARDPEALLREAGRVARRVVVVEDTYAGRLQRAVTLFADSVVNWEFQGHPHNNRSDAEWCATFARLDFRLRASASWPIAGVFRQSLYVLDS